MGVFRAGGPGGRDSLDLEAGLEILAGDIGGTNARLAVFEKDGPIGDPSIFKTYASGEFPTLEDVLRRFLSETGVRPAAVALGIAGVIRRNQVEMMANLPWKPDAAAMSANLGLPPILFLNDLEAAAWGVSVLGPSGQATLLEGESDPDGNRCLLAAGTGLGEAGIVRTAEGWLPFRSEGGHANFAPRDELEIELLRALQARYGHVSFERVLSGPGLYNIYKFLRDTGRGAEPPWLHRRLRDGSPGRVITDCAMTGESELCEKAVGLFVRIYGTAAGNLALKTLATGGVWLSGGIAPRLLSRLQSEEFRESFQSKGRMRGMMERIPVRVATDGRLAVLGAANAAVHMVLESAHLSPAGR